MINSIILFVALVSAIIFSVPIPMAMGIAIILVFLIGGYPFYLIAQGLISTTGKWTLLAVPFFIMAGGLMNNLGITERLFHFATVCVGHIKGGLAHVNILASMIFAGISGSATADVAGLGRIEMKAMAKAGFDKRDSAAITLASSVLGPIIPPSISFILYGIIANVSIAKMFLAGIVPGVLIAFTLMLTVYIKASINPDRFPTEKKSTFSEVLTTTKGTFLVIISPVIILLGMTTGFVSPTEAGAAACLYTLFLGIIYRTLKWRNFWPIMKDSMIQSAYALLLVALAGVMGYIFTYERTPYLFVEFVGNIARSSWSLLLFIDILLLIVGCFMSATASLIILTPILLPLITKFGIDPIHFGVIISYGLIIGIATPPVGIGLYLISDIAELKFEDTVAAVVVYLIPLIASLFIITYFPQLSLWLPNMLMK